MSRVTKVKGVSPNFMNFFWSNMSVVRINQSQGDYATALKLMATFVSYLPDEMRKLFDDDKKQIISSMNTISSGNLPEVRKVLDPFKRQIYIQRLLNTYAYIRLDDFINKISGVLTKRGYLEIVSKDIEGSDLTDWSQLYKR